MSELNDDLVIKRDRPLHDQVLEGIERLILSGELRPGDPLRENTLAEKWGVSRTTIREACRVLQQAGLVDIARNRGVFVREVSLRDILHLFDIRAALWGLAAREATLNITRRHLEHLEDLVAQIEKVIEQNDDDGYLELNRKFHDAIVTLSRNRPLARLHRELFNQTRLVRRGLLAHNADRRQRNDDHRKLVEAMRSGDGEEAGRVLEAHVLQRKQFFMDSIGTPVDPFGDVFAKDADEDAV